MIKDITIDQALIELKRTEKALKALKSARNIRTGVCSNQACNHSFIHRTLLVDMHGATFCSECGGPARVYRTINVKEHATAKRASMDLTRKLADLRAGR